MVRIEKASGLDVKTEMDRRLTGEVHHAELGRIRCLHDNVLLRVLGNENEEKVSPGGIVVPATAKKPPRQRGEVVAVGAKVQEVRAGRVVFFDFGTGSLLRIDGTEFLMIAERNICAVLESDAPEVVGGNA